MNYETLDPKNQRVGLFLQVHEASEVDPRLTCYFS